MLKVDTQIFNRIHVNSINMSYSGMLSSGGIGFAIAYSPINVSVCYDGTASNDCHGFDCKRLDEILQITSVKYSSIPVTGWTINVSNKLRSHIGLGSTTQIESQILSSILQIGSKRTPNYQDFIDCGIGMESGIGLKCYLNRGFQIDFGYWRKPELRGLNSSDATINSLKLAIPEEWKLLLMIPKDYTSISGSMENSFWDDIIPVPATESMSIAFSTLMGLIPSVMDGRLDKFLGSLRAICSFGTKPAEIKLNSPFVERLYPDIEMCFGFCGLSSLGPTCYTFYLDNSENENNIQELQRKHMDFDFIRTRVFYD